MIQQSPLSCAPEGLEYLGEGGMAVVYRGLDAEGEPVAVKVLREALRGDAEAQRRFKAEYRVLAALDHPGIPAAHGQGLSAEGLPYYAMTLVGGESLEALGPVDAEQARALLAELLPILSHVHRRGLVHGDLKAENLMRAEDGRLMLMDFGLAGPAGARPHGLEGTVTHLAPELIQRGRADQRTDLYALGVILYKWLTGQLPILGASPAETLRGQVETLPAPPSTLVSGLDPELDGLTLRLLAKRPQDRPQSANEVLRTLGFEAEEETLALPLQAAFVGRAGILGELLAHVSPLAAGQRSRPLLLKGTSGSGKTRLLEELAQQARALDLAVVTGRAPAGGAPWGLWLDLCRELTAVARTRVPDEGAALEAALAPLASAPDAGAVQAFEAALTRVVQAIARRQGLLLLLDDWEQADTASRDLALALSAKDAPSGWILAGHANA
ncbi:MAG TPA: serine/threonine-protein kinase, partial [Oscillatoriaceae cyanobacterium]